MARVQPAISIEKERVLQQKEAERSFVSEQQQSYITQVSDALLLSQRISLSHALSQAYF